MDHPDFRKPDTVVHRTAALGLINPSVVTRSRHGERAAHEPDGIAAAVLVNHAIFHRFLREARRRTL
ncbi:MAG: hypothetical protein ABIU05_10155 [Nitrospirales bacterium]